MYLRALTSLTICGLLSAATVVAREGHKRKDKDATKKAVDSDPNTEVAQIRKTFRLGTANAIDLWQRLDQVYAKNGAGLADESRSLVLQMQAQLLAKGGYPVLAAAYAADGIKLANDPYGQELSKTWALLGKISRLKPIQYILEDLAGALDQNDKNASKVPPDLGNDWAYVRGNAAAAKGDDASALGHYKKLKMADRYFMPAQYEVAMILINQKKEADAEIALRAILNTTTMAVSTLPSSDRLEMKNYALMALGRLYYQKGEFQESVREYRRVSKNSPLFYDALFEQSWALFMGGYPGHSLGALYGVGSPFFKNHFNPEAKVLEAIEHYWMCRYDDSKNALADFTENHSEAVESLGAFLNRQRLTPNTAYTLFENVVAGVSSASLGIPRNVLVTAAEKDTILLLRDQYATVVEERTKLETKGIFGRHKMAVVPLKRIESYVKQLKSDLGEQFLVELKSMKQHFDDLYAQSQFLYLELLMSEKERLLGRELHAPTKLTSVSNNLDIRGWGKKTQYWEGGVVDEYWWDEVGFHIYRVKPECNVN